MAVGIGFIAVFMALAAILVVPMIKFVRLWTLINKFEGPPAIPLLGNALQLQQGPSELVRQFLLWLEIYREKGNGIMRLWIGPVPTLWIFKASAVEQILSSSRHIKKGFMYAFLEPWLGLGLLTSTGEKWFHRRKMLTPTFHFAILQNFLDSFNEHSATLCRKLDELADQRDVDVFPLITLCVLDIICETAMGKRLNAQENKESDYVNAVLNMADVVQERQKTPWYWPNVLFGLTKTGKNHAKFLDVLHNMTNTIIEERSKEPPKNFDQSEERDIRKTKIAFLDMLLKMHREDPSFTFKDIREEVDTFMFEGHDTTAALATWTLFFLGHYPKVQKKLHQELDEVFGDSDRPITADDLNRLPYLSCVLKETLRMTPSVPIVARDLQEDITIDGKLVPKETLIIVSIAPLHRDPEQFPDEATFNPDNFLPEVAAKRHAYAYVPFSAGPRNCIGQKFAMMEDKIIIASMLRKFSFKSTQSLEDTRPKGELILRPSRGLKLRVARRK